MAYQPPQYQQPPVQYDAYQPQYSAPPQYSYAPPKQVYQKPMEYQMPVQYQTHTTPPKMKQWDSEPSGYEAPVISYESPVKETYAHDASRNM